MFIPGIALVGASFLATVFRSECTGFITRIFDADQQIQDGAFAAELLDSVSKPKVDMEWWVIRDGVPATEYKVHDPRRLWKKGKVVRIDAEDSSMVVQLTRDNSAGCNAGADAGSSGTGADSSAVSGSETVAVKFGGSNFRTAEELLHEAQQNMRCVTWSAITLALLENNTNTHGAQQAQSAYSVSQPVAPGTKIDFFISHSWHDDPIAKFAALEQVAEDFVAKHGREPTFWLDVACINQDTISDGLKVLPINLMACRQVLVLVGLTYSQRLWCMWELYVLAMFNNENVMDKVHVAEHAGAGVNLSKVLGLFSFDSAHCFDPNEEARLRGVIEAGGEEDFCRSLRALGRQIGHQNKQNAALQELIGGQNEMKQETKVQREEMIEMKQEILLPVRSEMKDQREEMREMKQDMKELIGGQNVMKQEILLAVRSEMKEQREEMREMREMCTKMMAMLDAKEKLK